MDITPMLNDNVIKGDQYRFFIRITDSIDDNKLTIVKELSIIDKKSNTEIECDDKDVTVNGSTIDFTVDYTLSTT